MALNLMEYRFLKSEVDRRGLPLKTLLRLCARGDLELTATPDAPCNALWHLYDRQDHPPGVVTQETAALLLQPGDLVYIQGDPGYKDRFKNVATCHSNQGWHLAYVGPAEDGQPLFVGFSEKMSRSFTYGEVRELLLEEYPPAVRPQINIGGIIMARRLNEDRLEAAIAGAGATESAEGLGHVSPENQGSTLESFQAVDATAARMLQVVKDFVERARQAPGASHLLLLEGDPGLGKTHLACSLLSCLRHDGRSTAYLTQGRLGAAYNEYLGLDRVGGERKFWDRVGRLLQADVVVVDDVNSYFGVARSVQALALQRAAAEPKVVIVTANRPTTELSIGTDHQALHRAWAEISGGPPKTSTVIDGLHGTSRRGTGRWTAPEKLPKTRGGQIDALLANTSNTSALLAGVVVDGMTADQVAAYARKKAKAAVKVLAWEDIDRPYFSQETFQADVVVAEVPKLPWRHKYGRVVRLVEGLYELGGKKLILVSQEPPAGLASTLTGWAKGESAVCSVNTERVLDRLRAVFPGVWPGA